ncbi:MAG: ATP phosphoribosyltransferase regulatory subunit [Phycisphaerae bacterium]|nr:ATP phosphoribosyltransferase regulatory subunit [Phycisphaerae bacterium]
MTDAKPSKRTLRAPPGTRDFYPADLLRRRYIEKAWRDTAIRHGFEEIDGPTFETADLYKVKSGEGILGEMFGVFSGKAEEDLKQLRETGEAPFALRPEFTPTLARMYAARAAQLPKPCKWFWQQTCFRAERQQRGRLREFMQWNCDILGADGPMIDAELMSVVVAALEVLGLTPNDCRVRYSHRSLVASLAGRVGVPEGKVGEFLAFLDGRAKRSPEANTRALAGIGLDAAILERYSAAESALVQSWNKGTSGRDEAAREHDVWNVGDLNAALFETQIHDWCTVDLGIVRGLAYYTGAVFEVIAEGERAVAGGGRYDGLIELFGGPPTPAAGFGMGDVVLANLLGDRNLLPTDGDLVAAMSSRGAGVRPDVFVISNGEVESDHAVARVTSDLRRGVESEAWRSRDGRKPWDPDRYSAPPLHARHSYKATKNIGKLLQEASACHARFAAIIESAEHATLKNLDTRHEEKHIPLDSLAARIHSGMSPARA